MWRLLGGLILGGILSSCGVQIEPGQQQAGQTCYKTTDCAAGLMCFERRCAPGVSVLPSNNTNPNNQNNVDPNNVDPNNININNINPNNIDPNNLTDMGPSCEVGDVKCIDRFTAEVCVSSPNGPMLVTQRCASCEDGRCVPAGECVDRDGDGYFVGPNCPGPQDCDDTNPLVHPNRPEDCSTPWDDNCDGRINEGCDAACCPNGCPMGTFCDVGCACTAFNPSICQYQNQPCSSEGTFNNGLYCLSFGGEPSRCYGLCDQLSADPSSTCPVAGTVCAFGEDDFGVCLSQCAPGNHCGTPDLGCLPFGDQDPGGLCLPANPANQIGERCNPNESFPCESGAICVPGQNPNVGRCVEACRPFRFALMSGTDCSDGHCIPFTPDIGVCRRDNIRTEGEPCAALGTACNQDSVGCFQSLLGNRCQRLCRLNEGDSDCTAGTFCNQFSPEQNELGVCVVLGP